MVSNYFKYIFPKLLSIYSKFYLYIKITNEYLSRNLIYVLNIFVSIWDIYKIFSRLTNYADTYYAILIYIKILRSNVHTRNIKSFSSSIYYYLYISQSQDCIWEWQFIYTFIIQIKSSVLFDLMLFLRVYNVNLGGNGLSES